MRKYILLLFVAIGILFTPFHVDAAKVVIDPGHGGKDPGAVANGLQEKNVTLDISRKINQKLQKNYVVETKMTRNSDVYLTLNQRTNMANQWGANLFLSVHINAGRGSGYEDYTYTIPSSKDKQVQAEINKEVNKVLQEYKKVNRGQKKANFHVLRESRMASVLIEVLFIDNVSDANLLKNDNFLNDFSEAVAIGVGNALNLPERNGQSIVSKPSKPKVESVTINKEPSKPTSSLIKTTKASGDYVVTATSLNVREGNGTNYKAIGYLKKNDTVKITGKTTNNWYQFNHNGKVGYVSGNYLQEKSKPVTKPQKQAVATPKKVNAPAPKKSATIKVTKTSGEYIVTASSLNVREGNGTNYKVIGYLMKNSSIKVTGITSNNWYQFNHKGQVGYASGLYLKTKPVPKSNKSNQVTKKTNEIYQVTASALRVRSSNNTKSKIVGMLYKGAKVEVLDKTSNNWYRISYKGKTSYVSGDYLKKVK